MSRLRPAAAFAQPLALSVSLPDGALFTKNEPTLTRTGPESRVHLKAHSCYCTIYGFRQMCNDIPKSIAVGCVSLCVCARVRLFSVNEPS